MDKVKFKYIGTKRKWWDDKVEFQGIIYHLQLEKTLPKDVFAKAKKEGKVEEIKPKKEIKENG